MNKKLLLLFFFFCQKLQHNCFETARFCIFIRLGGGGRVLKSEKSFYQNLSPIIVVWCFEDLIDVCGLKS